MNYRFTQHAAGKTATFGIFDRDIQDLGIRSAHMCPADS